MRSSPDRKWSTIAYQQHQSTNTDRRTTEAPARADPVPEKQVPEPAPISAVTRPDWLTGYSQLVTNRIREGWAPYLVTVLFKQIPRRRAAVMQRMTEEVQRLYSTLVTRVHRKPRQASADELPLLVGAFDLPVYKRDKSSSPLVSCNSGLHFHAVVLLPPKSRLGVSLAKHIGDNADLYCGSKGSIQRIDVRPMVDRYDRVVDYVFKTILSRRLSYDDGVLVLPRVASEL
jgi:hypothetical protein